MAIASKVKTLSARGFDKAKTAKASATVAMMVAAAQVMPVYCLNTDITLDDLWGRLLGVLFYALQYGGLFMFIWNAIKIFMNMHRQQGDNMQDAQWAALAGALLFAARFVLGGILDYVGVTVIMPG